MGFAFCGVMYGQQSAVPAVDPMGRSVSNDAGGIVIDGSTVTGVDRAQNGVPVVNIACPSSSGVSSNHFRDFNVGRDSVIMNNSGQLRVSVLGGALYSNPNIHANQ